MFLNTPNNTNLQLFNLIFADNYVIDDDFRVLRIIVDSKTTAPGIKNC